MIDLSKYRDLYDGLDILTPFSTESSQSAFLLVGEDSDGLGVVARLLAARLTGIDVSRAFEDHADIMVYPKPATADGRTDEKKSKADNARRAPVNVDDIRDILDSLYLTPFELKRRIYIIEDADGMSEICQNKLLKSLEEPPKTVCFILCAPGAMLPTVESRCITAELAPFPIDTVYRRLSAAHADSDDATVKLAARASRGNIGMAERILADKNYISAYGDALKILRLASGSRMFAKTAAVYDKYTRERVVAVLGLMEYLLGDISRELSNVPTVFDPADVKSAAVGFTPYSAAVCAEHVRNAGRRVQANCMPQAVMDGLILKIMEEKALCRK